MTAEEPSWFKIHNMTDIYIWSIFYDHDHYHLELYIFFWHINDFLNYYHVYSLFSEAQKASCMYLKNTGLR